MSVLPAAGKPGQLQYGVALSAQYRWNSAIDALYRYAMPVQAPPVPVRPAGVGKIGAERKSLPDNIFVVYFTTKWYGHTEDVRRTEMNHVSTVHRRDLLRHWYEAQLLSEHLYRLEEVEKGFRVGLLDLVQFAHCRICNPKIFNILRINEPLHGCLSML